MNAVLLLLHAATNGNRRIYRRLLLLTSIPVIADFLIINSLLQGMSQFPGGVSEGGALLVFLAAVGLFYIGNISQQREGARLFTESARDRLTRLAGGLLRLPLSELESMGKGTLMTRLVGDSSRVGTASRAALGILTSGIRALLTGLLGLTLSAEASAVAFCGLFLVGALAFQQLAALRDGYRQVGSDEAQMYELLQSQVRGVIQLKLHRLRADSLARVLESVSARLRTVRATVFKAFYDHQYTADALLFGLLGSNVFIVPLFLGMDGEAVRKANLIILWLVRPVVTVIARMPQLSEAAAALERLQALETQLTERRLERPPSGGTQDGVRFASFSAITMRRVQFRYQADSTQHGFWLAPANLTFRRGELIYVTGPNGGGKSTFLKLLLGLYPPDDGEICVDGTVIDQDSLADYRALFGTIFTDHCLYARIPRLTPAGQARAEALLRELGLSGKTAIEGDRVVERNLSTGQKKRLAMVLTQLRDRPIYIFDEWAADQDPEYRADYYQRILPALRDAGKLVIVVTHDDQYFHLADRVFVLQNGVMTEASPPSAR